MLEICCFDIESAIKAAEAGADRIELCANKPEGGITPSLGMIKEVLKHVQIPVYVMIRPRGGDFLYSKAEKSSMLSDIDMVVELGAAGIVCGALNTDGKLDEAFLKDIISHKKSLKFTFHRAFDRCSNPIEAIEILIQHKVDTILTSGQKEKAIDGLENLRQYTVLAKGKINIMVGSGVLPSNMNVFAELGIKVFHFSASQNADSNMVYINESFSTSDGSYPSVNMQLIREAKNIIEKL